MDKLGAILAYVGIGVVVGTLSALLGIGGGVLLVPVLVMVWAYDMHTAVGTSLVVVFAAALAGTIRHYSFANVNLPVGLVIASGAMLGSYFIGAPLAEATPADLLKKIFGIVMILVGLQMTGLLGHLARLAHFTGTV